MTTISVNLPTRLKAFVDEQIASGKSESAEALLVDLLNREYTRAERERVDALIQEGVDSGPYIEVTPDYWSGLNERLTGDAKVNT